MAVLNPSTDPTQNGLPPGWTIDPNTGQWIPPASNGAAPTPGSGGVSNTSGNLSGGPNTHWDATTGTFVPNTDTSLPGYQPGGSAATGGGPATGTHWDPQSGTYVDDTTTAAPAAGTTGTSGAQNINGSILAPFTEQLNAPTPQALPTAPSYTGANAPPTLGNIPQFTAPSIADAMAQPGYQFQLQQGANQLQNWAGAKGTLNDSSTADALQQFGQNSAQSDYQNVWNNDYSAYNANVNTQYTQPYNAAFANWQSAVQQPGQQNYQTQNANVLHQNDQSYANAYNKWLSDLSIFQDQRDSTFNKTLAYAQAG